MIRIFRQILGVAYLQSIFIRRQPLWIVQGFVASAGMMAVMFVWGGLEALRNLVTAYVIIGAWGQGLNIVAQIIGWSRQGHELERLVASPVTLPIYFIGVAIGTSPFMLPTLMPALILMIFVGVDLPSFLALLFLTPIALILGAFMSIAIIIRIKNPTNISAITNPLYTVTTILPPVYYPVNFLPPLLREISMAIPTVSLMEIARWIAGVRWTYEPSVCLFVIATWMAIVTLLVMKKLKWGME